MAGKLWVPERRDIIWSTAIRKVAVRPGDRLPWRYLLRLVSN